MWADTECGIIDDRSTYILCTVCPALRGNYKITIKQNEQININSQPIFYAFSI
jgi:hypothetical protein